LVSIESSWIKVRRQVKRSGLAFQNRAANGKKGVKQAGVLSNVTNRLFTCCDHFSFSSALADKKV